MVREGGFQSLPEGGIDLDDQSCGLQRAAAKGACSKMERKPIPAVSAADCPVQEME